MFCRSVNNSARPSAQTDRLIRLTKAFAVIAVACVAAIISTSMLTSSLARRGRGLTARLLPFTVDGLIWVAPMVVLDASRRGQPDWHDAGYSHCA
jgi:hypothetical protein